MLPYCRELHGNRIQNISRDTFSRLTSLQVLYVFFNFPFLLP